jgi:hypothetical protein
MEARQQWLGMGIKDFLSAKSVASRLTPATALSSTDLMGDLGKWLFEPN